MSFWFTQKLIVEIKAKSEIDDVTVQAKARAAVKWVTYANVYAAENRNKQWSYALVPHDVVGPSATLAGLLARHGLLSVSEPTAKIVKSD